MRRIWLIPPAAAVVIAGLVAYRSMRPPAPAPTADVVARAVRPAPLFRLNDERMRPVRLEAYVGRHKLLVVFFDGERSPDPSPLLLELRDGLEKITAAGAKVFAISGSVPARHRELIEREGPFHFPMLSDILESGVYGVHRQWGAFDERADRPIEAVFIVDGAGIVRHAHLAMDDLGTAEDWASELRKSK